MELPTVRNAKYTPGCEGCEAAKRALAGWDRVMAVATGKIGKLHKELESAKWKISEMDKDFEKIEDENEKMREWLEDSEHKIYCKWRMSDFAEEECTCGLDELLKGRE